MRPRHHAAAALLSLAFFVPGCTDTEEPTQLMTSPVGAVLDVSENTCPTTSGTEVTMDEDDREFISVFVRDHDPGASISLVITESSRHANVRPSGTLISYEPGEDFCGTDVVKYKAFDGICYSEEATIDITVTCVQDCPTPIGGVLEVDKNGSVSFDLGPSSDVDGEAITYAVAQAPAHGIVILNTATGAGGYTPHAGYCGADAFTVTASDGICTSAAGTLTIEVDCGDSDGDGVSDTDDDCASSNTGATVSIDGCDSGVANPVDANGCSLADKVAGKVQAASTTAKNHGKFVAAMARDLNAMVNDGTITAAEKDALMRCVGSSTLNKAN